MWQEFLTSRYVLRIMTLPDHHLRRRRLQRKSWPRRLGLDFSGAPRRALCSVVELRGAAANRQRTTAWRSRLWEGTTAPRVHGRQILVFSDSKYVIDGVTKWVASWKAKGWKKADGKDVMNLDFWKRLVALVESREEKGGIEWRYVKGHSGDAGNDRCDEIAVAYSHGGHPTLYAGLLENYAVRLKLA